MPIEISDTDMKVCGCCGQQRPYPTREGLWEVLYDPQFNPDGSLVTERTFTTLVAWDGAKIDPPRKVSNTHKVEQIWVRVSVVDVSHLNGDGPLLLVPSNSVHAIWWPDRSIWRKIGDKPEIKWQDVVERNYRLGDGKFVPSAEDLEDETPAERQAREEDADEELNK